MKWEENITISQNDKSYRERIEEIEKKVQFLLDGYNDILTQLTGVMNECETNFTRLFERLERLLTKLSE